MPDQLDSLSEQFQSKTAERGYAKAYEARDAVEAAANIGEIAGPGAALAINKAGIIGELRSALEDNGHRLIHNYLAGYPRGDDAEVVLHHYWQLPDVSPESAYQSFSVQSADAQAGRKDYTALLGASAAAADDGTVVFLQHTSNVSQALVEAARVVLIVGVDKVVRSRDDAVLQARSMGAFGLESVILNLSLPDSREQHLELEALPLDDIEAKIHVILLDNGRCELAQRGEFADLLTCMSCQACAVPCPTHRQFNCQLGDTPKQYLWAYLLGLNPSLELCIGCGMCLAQCPLDIDLPRLISTARSEGLAPRTKAIPNRLLHDAWLMMHLAHKMAPAANRLLKNKATRGAIEKATGFERDAWVPTAQRETFLRWFRSRQGRGAGV